MVGEVLLGLFCLALGYLFLSEALLYRWTGYTRPKRRSAKNEGSDRPKMIISVSLGIFFLFIGKEFLVMGLSAMF
jgi:hypothetical protein